MKPIILACCVILVNSASLAQPTTPRPSTGTFYVVLDTRANKCTVVDKEPKTDTANITVATDAVYTTRAEAEAALPTLKPCMR